MQKIPEVAGYICEFYPHKQELSKTRLTKLVYLVDWEAARRHGRQLTGIKWFFHNFGPYVSDVIETVSEDSRFVVSKTANLYGNEKLLVALAPGQSFANELSDEDKVVIDSVIEKTKKMYWDEFMRYIYATKPIVEADRFEELDLVYYAESLKK